MSKKRNPVALRFVEVLWTDANTDNTWTEISEVIEVALVITRGWVVKDDDKQLVLASTVGFEASGKVDTVHSTIAIPKGMIESVIDFPRKTRKKQKAHDMDVKA